MKYKVRNLLMSLLVLSALMITSCSTPAYKQNKYKKAKRSRDCGCNFQKVDPNAMYSYNDQR
ncbi:MAG: hypothetical protein AB9834_20905 [Lentimicrobium sp.]